MQEDIIDLCGVRLSRKEYSTVIAVTRSLVQVLLAYTYDLFGSLHHPLIFRSFRCLFSWRDYVVVVWFQIERRRNCNSIIIIISSILI